MVATDPDMERLAPVSQPSAHASQTVRLPLRSTESSEQRSRGQRGLSLFECVDPQTRRLGKCPPFVSICLRLPLVLCSNAFDCFPEVHSHLTRDQNCFKDCFPFLFAFIFRRFLHSILFREITVQKCFPINKSFPLTIFYMFWDQRQTKTQYFSFHFSLFFATKTKE